LRFKGALVGILDSPRRCETAGNTGRSAQVAGESQNKIFLLASGASPIVYVCADAAASTADRRAWSRRGGCRQAHGGASRAWNDDQTDRRVRSKVSAFGYAIAAEWCAAAGEEIARRR